MSKKIGEWNGKKRKFEFELEGGAALAFEKALFGIRVELGHNPRFAPNAFAAWLLERAAESYAEADRFSRSTYWKFELKPRSFEESVASDICWDLEKDPTQFPKRKRVRAPHQRAGTVDVARVIREMIAVVKENTEPEQFENIRTELLRLEERLK